MAKEAVAGSDIVILTSDNPRNEDPMDILSDMKAGLNGEESALVLTIPDRREAIFTAVKMAKSGDIILVAGKGHEDYQEINGIIFCMMIATELFYSRKMVKNICCFAN